MKGVGSGALAAYLVFSVGFLQAQETIPARATATPVEEHLIIPKVFHIAGIPSLPRNARVTLTVAEHDLILEHGKKEAMRLPFERIRHVQILPGERHYPEATYAAAVATFGIGGLLILKKRKMDTLVIDFVSERGGKMGMVLQLPLGQGAACTECLAHHGITVEQPVPPPAGTEKRPK